MKTIKQTDSKKVFLFDTGNNDDFVREFTTLLEKEAISVQTIAYGSSIIRTMLCSMAACDMTIVLYDHELTQPCLLEYLDIITYLAVIKHAVKWFPVRIDEPKSAKTDIKDFGVNLHAYRCYNFYEKKDLHDLVHTIARLL